MKKVLKWAAIVLGILVGGAFLAGWIIHEPPPAGKPGPEAEALARKMLRAINKEAWDSTRYVQWEFAGNHQYLWDKKDDQVIVRWDDHKVLLHTRNQQGLAWQNDLLLQGEKADELLARAWSFFCNDSFWLNAPAKIFDAGTERRLVNLENGEEALLVHYTSGGVTPGDRYLWILDANGRPKAWKMWVEIIPIGGIKSSWEGWHTLSTGALIATEHRTAGIEVTISDVAAGNSLASLGIDDNPFRH